MLITKEWHASHHMPKNATIDHRIAWHIEHVKNCKCRSDIPKKLKEEMVKRGITVFSDTSHRHH